MAVSLRPDGTPYPYDVRQAKLRQDRGFMGKHGLFKNAVLPTIGFAAGGAGLAALGGGAGAAGASASAAYPGAGLFGAPAVPVAASAGTGIAGATGAGMTLGKLWDIGNLGLQGASAFFGQRSQNRALDKQMAMQREEINARMLADAEARAEQKRQFDAQQANEARRYAAEDEDRLFNRRILEDREARLASKRAYADRARTRLFQFLGLG